MAALPIETTHSSNENSETGRQDSFSGSKKKNGCNNAANKTTACGLRPSILGQRLRRSLLVISSRKIINSSNQDVSKSNPREKVILTVEPKVDVGPYVYYSSEDGVPIVQATVIIPEQGTGGKRKGLFNAQRR